MKRVLFILLAFVACGDDTTEPTTDPPNIAGAYATNVSTSANDILLDAAVNILLDQDGGTLSGSYNITGTLTDDDTNIISYESDGTITGTISGGDTPTITLTARPTACPNTTAIWSGPYDAETGAMALSGSIIVFGESCSIDMTFAPTMILRR